MVNDGLILSFQQHLPLHEVGGELRIPLGVLVIDGHKLFKGLRGKDFLTDALHAYPVVAPIEDSLACFLRDGEVGLSRKEVGPVLGGDGLMLHVDVKDNGELIIYAIPHHGFQAHLFRHHLAVFLAEHIVLLAAHGADDMTARLQNPLHESIHPWRYLLPVGEAVALQASMVFQEVVPARRDAVDDDDLHACLLADFKGFHIGFRPEIFLQGQHIVASQRGIEVCTAMLAVYDGHLAPIPAEAIGQQQG